MRYECLGTRISCVCKPHFVGVWLTLSVTRLRRFGICGCRYDVFVGLPLELNDMYWLAEVLPQVRQYDIYPCKTQCRAYADPE